MDQAVGRVALHVTSPVGTQRGFLRTSSGSRVPTLAEALTEAGYRTIGVTANFVHVNERWGFDRGFESWESFSVEVENDSDVLWRYEHQPGAFVPLRAPNADEVNRELLDRLDARLPGPFFSTSTTWNPIHRTHPNRCT